MVNATEEEEEDGLFGCGKNKLPLSNLITMYTYKRLSYKAIHARGMYGQCARFIHTHNGVQGAYFLGYDALGFTSA